MMRYIMPSLALILALFEPSASYADELEAGQIVFIRECEKCHSLDGRNKVGPHLNGLFGRKAGSVRDFKYYSGANRNAGFIWDRQKFESYIQNPRGMIVGTTQIYQGLTDLRDIKALSDFLEKN